MWKRKRRPDAETLPGTAMLYTRPSVAGAAERTDVIMCVGARDTQMEKKWQGASTPTHRRRSIGQNQDMEGRSEAQFPTTHYISRRRNPCFCYSPMNLQLV